MNIRANANFLFCHHVLTLEHVLACLVKTYLLGIARILARGWVVRMACHSGCVSINENENVTQSNKKPK